MSKWFAGIIDRLFVVIGALLFLQFPLFMQQYQYRLSGHVSELQIQVDAMQRVARASHKTLDDYIQKFRSSRDKDFSGQGELMHAMHRRFLRLTDSLTALQRASTFTKPFVFISRLDYEIMKASLFTFSPGILLTFEGMIYAFVGLGAGCLFYLLIAKLTRLTFARQSN